LVVAFAFLETFVSTRLSADETSKSSLLAQIHSTSCHFGTMKKPNGAEIKRRLTSVHAWELPKQTGALAPEYVWVR